MCVRVYVHVCVWGFVFRILITYIQNSLNNLFQTHVYIQTHTLHICVYISIKRKQYKSITELNNVFKGLYVFSPYCGICEYSGNGSILKTIRWYKQYIKVDLVNFNACNTKKKEFITLYVKEF